MNQPKIVSLDICQPLARQLYSEEPRIIAQHGPDLFYSPSKTHIIINHCLPDNGMSFYEHEMAHFLEMGNLNRLLQYDFGIKDFIPKIKSCKNIFYMVLREARVRAIQDVLMSRPGFRRECEGFKHYIGTDFSFGKLTSSKMMFDYIHDIYDRTIKQWNTDRIVFEWCKRIDFVRDWMES